MQVLEGFLNLLCIKALQGLKVVKGRGKLLKGFTSDALRFDTDFKMVSWGFLSFMAAGSAFEVLHH